MSAARPQTQPITVFIHSFDDFITAVRVMPSDTIQSLDNMLSAQNTAQRLRIYIFNNLILLPSFTFQFHGVSDGSDIFVIEPKASKLSGIRHKGRRASSSQDRIERIRLFDSLGDDEAVQQVINEIADPSLAAESARIRDSFLSRVEGSQKLFFTRCKERDEENPFPTKIPTQSCDSPSKEALPPFWKLKESVLHQRQAPE